MGKEVLSFACLAAQLLMTENPEEQDGGLYYCLLCYGLLKVATRLYGFAYPGQDGRLVRLCYLHVSWKPEPTKSRVEKWRGRTRPRVYLLG